MFQKYHIQHEQVRLVQSGADYFNTLSEIIRNAERTLYLQTYIFQNDLTGALIGDTLCEASRRGVRVRLLLDDFGSGNLSPERLKLFSEAGVEFHFFGSYRHWNNLYWGRRLHHKVCVADAKNVLIGGINIADHYSGYDGATPWLDFALLVEGESIGKEIEVICETLWNKQHYSFRKRKTKPSGVSLISVLQHDYFRSKKHIYKAYLKAAGSARKEIIIFASYFLPGRRFINALSKAVRRGVQVTVVVQGKSDVPFVKKATTFLYGYCHRNKIEVLEWEPSVLHAKIAVVDGRWMTVGSYNLNHLSAYASIELNAAVNDTKMAGDFAEYLKNIIRENTKRVSPEENYMNFLQKVVNLFAYLLLRWSFRLLFLMLLTHKRWSR